MTFVLRYAHTYCYLKKWLTLKTTTKSNHDPKDKNTMSFVYNHQNALST